MTVWPYRDHQYPNTEALAPDEMRVAALDAGRPVLRCAQANTGWLVELGNGDKFMLDFGFGTQPNFAALEVPYNAITAVFATHLHTDHVDDFMHVRQGGWSGGCMAPQQAYGPTGPISEYGMHHFVEHQVAAFRWDADTRTACCRSSGPRSTRMSSTTRARTPSTSATVCASPAFPPRTSMTGR
jgi:ribonuclease Z